jgi:glycosyltransferase involved in cell wall biosynthesis
MTGRGSEGEITHGPPLRIAIVFDWFWSYVVPEAEALRRAGHSVLVVCRTHAEEFDGDFEERMAHVGRLRAAGVEILEVRGRVMSPSGWLVADSVRRALRRWNPDVLHVHENHDPRLLFIGTRTPVVLTIHDPRAHLGAHSHSGWRSAVIKAWRRRAKLLLLHSAALRQQLPVAQSSKPVVVVPHGSEVRSRPFSIPPDPRVLFFGRLEPYKGIDVLLAAMELVWSSRPEIKLTIAGRGTYALPVEVDSRIEIRNEYVPSDELDGLFARARLVVLPYRDASQSGVGSEAVARGIPIVATRVGGLSDLVPDDRFLVRPGDADGLARAILDHIDHDPPVRERTLQHAGRTLSWKVATQKAVHHYRQVMQ